MFGLCKEAIGFRCMQQRFGCCLMPVSHVRRIKAVRRKAPQRKVASSSVPSSHREGPSPDWVQVLCPLVSGGFQVVAGGH